MENYFARVQEDGYRPIGFDYIPLPHCARIHHLGIVLAEWHPKLSPGFSAESHVTADERPGPEGIPAASPSAPSSERLAVPTQLTPRGTHPDSDQTCLDPSNVARVGQATLTKG